MIAPLSTSLLLPAELADAISRCTKTVTGLGIENDFFTKILPNR